MDRIHKHKMKLEEENTKRMLLRKLARVPNVIHLLHVKIGPGVTLKKRAIIFATTVCSWIK